VTYVRVMPLDNRSVSLLNFFKVCSFTHT